MNKFRFTVYLAGPWFNDEQLQRHQRIANLLSAHDIEVFNPRLRSCLKPDSSDEDRESTFLDNIDCIEKADAVVVIYDGKDSGTIWETGYAYAHKKPIIFFAETLNGKPFNLMLAMTGYFVASLQDLDRLLDNMQAIEFKQVHKYEGDIQ